jgi:cell division protein FtsB
MANFQAGQRKKLTPRMRAWIAISILFIIDAILGRAAWNIYVKNRMAIQNKEATLHQLQDLEKRKTALEAKLARLKSDQGVEEEIRRSFPVAKEGEHVITIVRDNRGQDTSNAAASTSKAGFWQALFRSSVGE